MAGTTGFEPAITGSTVRGLIQTRRRPLRFSMVGGVGLEPTNLLNVSQTRYQLRQPPKIYKSKFCPERPQLTFGRKGLCEMLSYHKTKSMSNYASNFFAFAMASSMVPTI